jgi:hypothetical protein
MKKRLLHRHEREQLSLLERREPLAIVNENAGKRHRGVVSAAADATTARAPSLPVLVHVVDDIEMHEFIRRWHKAPTWAFSFVSVQASDDAAATVRGIAICFIDDLTTVQYVPFDGNRNILQLVDQQVRHQVFNRLFFSLCFFNFGASSRCLGRATVRIVSLAK